MVIRFCNRTRTPRITSGFVCSSSRTPSCPGFTNWPNGLFMASKGITVSLLSQKNKAHFTP